jgi:hypothetical protein
MPYAWTSSSQSLPVDYFASSSSLQSETHPKRRARLSSKRDEKNEKNVNPDVVVVVVVLRVVVLRVVVSPLDSEACRRITHKFMGFKRV